MKKLPKLPFRDYLPTPAEFVTLYALAWVALGGVLALLGMPAPWEQAAQWLLVPLLVVIALGSVGAAVVLVLAALGLL